MTVHDFCPMVDFCSGCGLAAWQFVETGGRLVDGVGPVGGPACPDDNPYFAAERRAEMRALVEPIIRRLGL